ncbi:MAG TPA: XdhC/CoxI family protein [Candidatus Agathobaculum merdigallinarum]|nr:XdhC/CoxI family protein [Candidatus Agathobaculum merdigallinarum]
MKMISKAIRDMCSRRQPFALVEIAEASGSMPRHQGATMLVRADGSIEGTIGGGLMEKDAIEKAKQVIAEGTDAELSFDMSSKDAANSDLICGGKGLLSIRYYSGNAADEQLIQALETVDKGRLYICGGGHVSLQIARIADLLEIPVTVIEDRAEYATDTRFPEAEKVVVDAFENIDITGLQEQDMVVIITRGHLGDRAALTWAVQTDAGYIGMIGSRQKRDLIYQKMMEDGTAEEKLQKVHSPIGLSIGAQTPAEIAVSIMAELIAFRYGKL